MFFGIRLTNQALAHVSARAFLVCFLAGHDVDQVTGAPPDLSLSYNCKKRIESILLTSGKKAPELGLYYYESSNHSSACLKLSRVHRDKSTPTGTGQWLMQFEVIGKNGITHPFCLPDNKGETWALAYREKGNINCQATSKTEPLPTSKTEPPLAPEGRLFSESFRIGLIGGWIGACSSFS
jgi:hypothetical protein